VRFVACVDLRAYCLPTLYMPAWMLRLARCLQCCVTLKLPDFPRVQWRGWHVGEHVGPGVGLRFVGGWMGLVGLFVPRAMHGRVRGGVRV
jgi:hypothetical protein